MPQPEAPLPKQANKIKATVLGTVSGQPPVVFHNKTQQVALVHVGNLNFDQHIRLYKVGDFNNFKKYDGSYQSYLAFYPNGKMLVSTDASMGDAINGGWRIRGRVGVIDEGKATGFPFRAEFNYGTGLHGSKLVALSPLGGFMALIDGSQEGIIYLVDFASTYKHPPLHEKAVTKFESFLKLGINDKEFKTTALKWAPDGKFIAQAGFLSSWQSKASKPCLLNLIQITRNEAGVSVFGPYGQIPLGEIVNESEALPLKAIAFSPDSSMVLIGGSPSAPLKLIDIKEKQIVLTVPYEHGSITALAFDEKTDQLISGDDRGNLGLWQLSREAEKIILQLEDLHHCSGEILAVCTHADQAPAYFAERGANKTVNIGRIDY
ncbi:MAG TPA: WD40 repeat domain-containing protein [Anaerolineales bacterium]|nr:WD40 repeat domain-containing protein [Anaerolineales bacterium]